MTTNNPRIYGNPPFKVVVLHGGPGAPGYMAPVARELASSSGVLEPLQTADSIEGQVQELKVVIEQQCDLPITLVGSSWGAMLGFIFTARHPEMVKRLILVGSAIYEEQYATNIDKTRLSRLTVAEQHEVSTLGEALKNPNSKDKNSLMARLGDLFTKAGTYNPITLDIETLECQYDLHNKVWREAVTLRTSGELVALGRQIRCPVVAIHGDYDPIPADGVKIPLSTILKHFQFFLLKKCGHLPWIEKEARDLFYELLKKQLP